MNGDYIIFICAAVWVFIILVGYYYPITKVKSTEYKEVVDLLGRNHFAKGLGELLRDEAQHASKKILSKRIAILGEWGVGKTNFLRLLQKDLLENNKRGESEFKVTMVNPWHAKSADEAWIVIANGIDEALGIYRGFLKLKQWSFVQWFLSFLGVEGLTTSALKGISSSDVEGAEKYINKVNSALKEKDYKVVIMVDDMERSSFSTIREIFSVIDQLEKFDHCSFVFAIDVDRIKKAFLEECSNEKLATEEAKGFVDKVFDVQWEIENPEEIEVKELVKFEMKEEMKLYPKLYDALDRLHFPSNPRLVKRFIDKAKMTERMFLNQRYKVNEHQFDVMFQIMLSDMVVDGTKRIILEKKDILKK